MWFIIARNINLKYNDKEAYKGCSDLSISNPLKLGHFIVQAVNTTEPAVR